MRAFSSLLLVSSLEFTNAASFESLRRVGDYIEKGLAFAANNGSTASPSGGNVDACYSSWEVYWAANSSILTQNPTFVPNTTQTETFTTVDPAVSGFTTTRSEVETNTKFIVDGPFTISTSVTTSTFIATDTQSAASSSTRTFTLTHTLGNTITSGNPVARPSCSLPPVVSQCERSWEAFVTAQLIPGLPPPSNCDLTQGIFQTASNPGAQPACASSYFSRMAAFSSSIAATPKPGCSQASIGGDLCQSVRDNYQQGINSYFIPESAIQAGPGAFHFNGGSLGVYNGNSISYTWPTSYTLNVPSCTLGCGRCAITGGTVQLMYWPPTTKTASAGEAVRTLVTDGTTLTSPTIYISYSQMHAKNGCGDVGTTVANTIIPIPTTQALSSVWGFGAPCDAHLRNEQDQYHLFTASFNVTDMQEPVPRSIYTSMPRCATEMHCGGTCDMSKPYEPILVVPQDVLRGIQPAWSECFGDLNGVYDPPIALLAVQTIAAPSVPGGGAAQPTAQPAAGPAPSTPQATSGPSPAAQPDNLSGPPSAPSQPPQVSQPPSNPSPANQPAPQGNPPQGSPSPNAPPQGSPSPNAPPQGNPSPNASPQGSPSPNAPPQGSPSPNAPPQGSLLPNAPSQGSPSPNAPPQGSPSPNAPPQSPSPNAPPQGSPQQNSPSQNSPLPADPQQSGSPQNTPSPAGSQQKDPPPKNSPPTNPQQSSPPQANPPSNSRLPPGDAAPSNPSPPGIAPSVGPVPSPANSPNSNPSAPQNSQGHPAPANANLPQVANQPVVIPLGTTAFSAISASQIIVGSVTVTPGGSRVTVSGTTFSLQSSASALIINGNTHSLVPIASPPAATGAAAAVASSAPTALTFASAALTFATVSGSNGAGAVVQAPSTTATLSANGAAVTVNGVKVSFGSSGQLVVGTSTTTLSSLSLSSSLSSSSSSTSSSSSSTSSTTSSTSSSSSSSSSSSTTQSTTGGTPTPTAGKSSAEKHVISSASFAGVFLLGLLFL